MVRHQESTFRAYASPVRPSVPRDLRGPGAVERHRFGQPAGWSRARRAGIDLGPTGPHPAPGAQVGVRRLDDCGFSHWLDSIQVCPGDLVLWTVHAHRLGVPAGGPGRVTATAETGAEFLLDAQGDAGRRNELLSPVLS